MRRNTVFKENNNLLLSGKDYLESFLVGSLSVGALHAKSTAIGLSSDVIGSIYKMKNSKGQHLPNETVKAYLSNNATVDDIQKMNEWGKDVKAEDIDKMTDDVNRIANAKIGGIAYGNICKATSKMDSGKAIELYYKIMSSPEYKAETERIKAYKAAGNGGDDSHIEHISSNPDNPNNNPIHVAGTEQTSAYPDNNDGGKLGNAGTMLANKTPDPQKPDDDIPMEKAANGYDDIYQYTDANSNNLNNKPLSMESRSEGQGGGTDVDVFNKNTDNSSTDSQSYVVGNAGGSQEEVSNVSKANENNAINVEKDIANSDEMRYKGEEGEKDRFIYKNNPMDNPKAAKDIIENPNAVYGYSPNPNSMRIGSFANKVDWNNHEQVEIARKARLDYHKNNNEMLNEFYNKGYTTEDIARKMVNERNRNRLNNYIERGDMEGYEIAKKSNLDTYQNSDGPTPEFLFSKYGSWEEVINASLSSNPGMDACVGLYDNYHGGK